VQVGLTKLSCLHGDVLVRSGRGVASLGSAVTPIKWIESDAL